MPGIAYETGVSCCCPEHCGIQYAARGTGHDVFKTPVEFDLVEFFDGFSWSTTRHPFSLYTLSNTQYVVFVLWPPPERSCGFLRARAP
eukprot:9284483-Lingulodinium_polyedra.AAC.1